MGHYRRELRSDEKAARCYDCGRTTDELPDTARVICHSWKSPYEDDYRYECSAGCPYPHGAEGDPDA